MSSLTAFFIASILAMQSSQVDVQPIMRIHRSITVHVVPCNPPLSSGSWVVCAEPDEPEVPEPDYCLDPTRFAMQRADHSWHCIKFPEKVHPND